MRIATFFPPPPPGVELSAPCSLLAYASRHLAPQPSRNDGIGRERGPFWLCRASEWSVRRVGRARSLVERYMPADGRGGGEIEDGKTVKSKRAMRTMIGAQYVAQWRRDDFGVGSSPDCNFGLADCLFLSAAFGKVINIASASERYLSKGPRKKPGAKIMLITFPPNFSNWPNG